MARDFKPILDNPLKHDGVYEIGIQLLDLLEVIHTAGYVYNQLSIDTISLGIKERIK